MTEYRDDHILVLEDDPHGGFRARIECPNEAKGEQGAWGKCAYLDTCGCDKLLADARDVLRKLTGTPDQDDDDALSPHDWVEGCYVQVAPSVRITVEEHKTCPSNGQKHHVWEGELVAPIGSCWYRGELAACSISDLMEPLPPAPGRYPVKGTWEDEYCFYLEVIS